MNMWRFLYYINKPSQVWFQPDFNFPNEVNSTFWAHLTTLISDDLWPWFLTFDRMNIQRVPYCINKPSLVPIELQLFKWSHFHIFSLSYNFTSDDLWPWYVTFDLINKWGFPCCNYDPTLVQIHQSMKKVEPNVNLFSQQQTTTGTKWSLCVFPAMPAKLVQGEGVSKYVLLLMFFFLLLLLFFLIFLKLNSNWFAANKETNNQLTLKTNQNIRKTKQNKHKYPSTIYFQHFPFAGNAK